MSEGDITQVDPATGQVQEAPVELNSAKGDGKSASTPRKGRGRSGSKKATATATSKKTAARSSGASSKKKAAASASKKRAAASTPREKFPEYKTQAAAEKVMKANLDGYKQYQVERDKNRNERGMEKHRLAYRTYKNAYGQLLALRKAAGLGRRNAATS